MPTLEPVARFIALRFFLTFFLPPESLLEGLNVPSEGVKRENIRGALFLRKNLI